MPRDGPYAARTRDCRRSRPRRSAPPSAGPARTRTRRNKRLGACRLHTGGCAAARPRTPPRNSYVCSVMSPSHAAVSCFGHMPVIELAVKQVAVAAQVRRHCQIEGGLEQRHVWHVIECQLNESDYIALVEPGVGGVMRLIDRLVQFRISVGHRIEDRVRSPAVDQQEEEIRKVEPAAEHLVLHGQRLLREGGAPVGARNLFYPHLDSNT